MRFVEGSYYETEPPQNLKRPESMTASSAIVGQLMKAGRTDGILSDKLPVLIADKRARWGDSKEAGPIKLGAPLIGCDQVFCAVFLGPADRTSLMDNLTIYHPEERKKSMARSR
jgi:hypothetical protein